MSTDQKNAETERLSVWSKLYRGRTDFQFVAKRKRWYLIAAIMGALCVAVMVFKGFSLGIDFAGGNQYTVPANGTTITEVEAAAAAAGAEIASGQSTGTGDDQAFVIRTTATDVDTAAEIRQAMADAVGAETSDIATATVSATWGASVSQKALLALIVFLVLITVFIWLRFERRMAIAAVAALAYDGLLIAGVFSLVGFEVTPSTMVGALTVLAYSLYDTVVVFDKVQENTAHLLQSRQKTFGEGVNDAINETLMRSLNTSMIGALPVGALLFIGVGLLGVGTLKDLALVLFVGIVVGTYSSIFLAAPWLVDLAERSAVYRRHNQKIASKRAGEPEDDRPARKGAQSRAAEDDDDDRLVRAKTDELPLELLEEPAPVRTGGGSRPRQNVNNSKRRKRR
ncbi:protein translocase subunit SecF [Glycomyces sp. NRRL B-16210]|uniref:protein translocase subunit SecF n=1 Tax=Glycomyces sp. NRRL B-16210 TaxID=1463821 RepID=UPI0006912EBC|nr:protein translocase subunit SecF [Glycomyces sp. NRRL B-16210]